MLLPITLTLAAACALLNFWLALRCGRIRMADKVLHGDGGNDLLARRMRAHANFIEYTPLVVILFALIELAWGASLWLWIAAPLYVAGRIAHALGMDAGTPTPTRAGGIMITMIVMLALAVTALVAAYTGMGEMDAPAMVAQG